MEYVARYVHKISPSEKDTKGPFALSDAALTDRTALGAALRRVRVLGKGDRIASFRVEPGFKVVVFPQKSIWHSIILELTRTGVHHLARESYQSTLKLAEKPDAFTHAGMSARVDIMRKGRDYLLKLSKAKNATDSDGKWNQSKAWADDLTRHMEKDEARRDYFEKYEREGGRSAHAAEKHERGDNPRTSSRGSKELLRTIRPYVKLYRDSKTGIAWVEDGTSGTGHSAHPNIHGTGSVTGMRTRGFWGAKDRTVRSHGFIYNIDRVQVSDELDRIARDACRCGGNHGEAAKHERGDNPRVSRELKARMDKVLGKRR